MGGGDSCCCGEFESGAHAALILECLCKFSCLKLCFVCAVVTITQALFDIQQPYKECKYFTEQLRPSDLHRFERSAQKKIGEWKANAQNEQ